MAIADDIQKVGKPLGFVREKAYLNGVPHYPEEGTILHGLYQEVLSAEQDGMPTVKVGCGAGLGSDHVTMQFGDETTTFYLRDVLKEWVKTLDPALAMKLPSVRVKVGERE
jgi:hypothetical protein